MTRFRMRWNHRTGESYEVKERAGPAPKRIQIMRSMEAYVSPASGRAINSRTDRNADMREHGCIDARDGPTAEQCAQIRERRFEESLTEQSVADVIKQEKLEIY